ncbi:MAG: SpoIIE family protein phosphatase [Bacteroidales bacterium]
MRRSDSITIMTLALMLICLTGHADESADTSPLLLRQDLTDSLRAVSLISRAELFADTGNPDSARIYFLEARQICTENRLPFTEAKIYEGLASLYDKSDIWDYSLRYMLMASSKYKLSHDSIPAAAIHKKIAARYNSFGVPALAAGHYIKEYSIYGDEHTIARAEAARNAAESFKSVPDTANALLWYDSAKKWYSATGNNAIIFSVNNRVIPLLSGRGDNNQALQLAAWNLERQSQSDREEMIILNNNIGFLHFRTGDLNSAINRFRRAEEYCLAEPVDENNLASVYSNMAVCYQGLGNNDLMFRYFMEAMQLAERTGQIAEKARIEMLLATIYNNRNDLYNAEVYCLDCITSSEGSGNYETLQICYALYAEILENSNDFIKALDYYQKHLNLRDSIAVTNRTEAEKQAERRLYYESIEQNLKLDIADEEKKDLELRSQRAELEKQEKEIELLYSEQERTRIEKENLMQSLALSREREAAERQKLEIQTLEQEGLRQQLELENKIRDERELQGQNELLESQAREKELELEKEKDARRMTLYIAILMVLIALVSLWALISVRRSNSRLAASKKKIEEINADLEVKNREVNEQKEIIEQKNQSITDSIQYAARIQNAVLLPIDFLTSWGIDNFILFKPKDIVSGDFYWGFRKKGRIFIAAADCTGHGVPGGFMSMLGNTFLNEIMITSDLATASEILDKLREEIIRALRQKGVTGEARDGMDISLIILDQKSKTVQYAGANNSIYVVNNGELTRHQADRMPIGIHVTDIAPFKNRIIKVEQGDVIYLFSDGYADQFGGESGKKFMYKPFQNLLLSLSQMPMEEQLDGIDTTFEEWKSGYEQIDDVLVIGLRIK